MRAAIARKLVLQGSLTLEEGLRMMDGEYDSLWAWHALEIPEERDMTHYRDWEVYDHLVTLLPYTKDEKAKTQRKCYPEDLPALLEKTYGHESFYNANAPCRISNEDFLVDEGQNFLDRYIIRFKKMGKIVSVPGVLKGLLEGTDDTGK